jgi:DNA-binding GntR family transcriptional regulator
MEPGVATTGDGASVINALEDDIIFGRLPPGQRLVEDTLMTRFAVTRHTIRQALVELERIGIVVRERHIGAAVRAFGREEVLQMYEVREVLQRQAALMISLPVNHSLIEKLTAINQEFATERSRGNLRGVHENNDRFHLLLFGACGNAYLVRSIAYYMAASLPMRAKTLGDDAAFATSLRQHDIMIAMLQQTDRWALSQLCVEHIWPSKRDYLAKIRDTA